MEGQRIARLREEIKRVVSDALRKLKDPRIGFVTVTDVELSGDLRHVKLFFSVYGDDEAKAATLAALERAKGFFRTEIGRQIRLRYTPEVHIKADTSIERGARIFELLRSVSTGSTAPAGGPEAERAAAADGQDGEKGR